MRNGAAQGVALPITTEYTPAQLDSPPLRRFFIAKKGAQMNAFSDAHHARMLSTYQGEIDAQAAREAWAEEAYANTSPFLPEYNSVVLEALANFSKGDADAICCHLQNKNYAQAGATLAQILSEMCFDGVTEMIEKQQADYSAEY